MKQSLKLTAILAIVLIAANSCTKEKRIEHRLSSRSGKWNIESVKYEEYENGSKTDEESYSDYGYFTFDEQGTVTMTITEDGDTYTAGGNWSNSKETLTMVIDGDAVIFNITESKRKEMTLEYVEEYNYNGINYKDISTYKIEKD